MGTVSPVADSKMPYPSHDQDKLYRLLLGSGPLTMRELRLQTNWTTKRTNDILQHLKRSQRVTLTERGRHYLRQVNSTGANWCGKWKAV